DPVPRKDRVGRVHRTARLIAGRLHPAVERILVLEREAYLPPLEVAGHEVRYRVSRRVAQLRAVGRVVAHAVALVAVFLRVVRIPYRMALLVALHPAFWIDFVGPGLALVAYPVSAPE